MNNNCPFAQGITCTRTVIHIGEDLRCKTFITMANRGFPPKEELELQKDKSFTLIEGEVKEIETETEEASEHELPQRKE
jgi:hypothetical protein